MILTCPACSTSYQVDASRFTPSGRKVRCAKCGHSWFQEPVVSILEDEPSAPAPEPEPQPEPELPPPPAEPEPEPGPEPEPEPEPKPVRARPSRVFVDDSLEPAPQPERAPMHARGDRRSARAEAYAPETHRRGALKWLLLAGIVGALMTAIVFMRQTIAEAWPATASFYALIGMPVNLAGLEIDNIGYAFIEDATMIEVSGNILNPTSRLQDVPMLVVTLRDSGGNEVFSQEIASGLEQVAPGAARPFVIRVPNHPEAKELKVGFAGVESVDDESGE